MHMRVEGPDKPKHDREQCLALAGIKWKNAGLALIRDLGGEHRLTDTVRDYPLPEARLEELLGSGARVQRQLADQDREAVLALFKVRLGIHLAEKQDEPAALERGVALLGESFPIVLREFDPVDSYLPTPLGWEAISSMAKALIILERVTDMAA
jgi:hypothetical protein